MSVAIGGRLRSGVVIVAILSFAAGVSAQTGKIVQGPCSSVFGAKVCTSYRIQSGRVTEMTMKVPIAAIEQAPPNVPMEAVLQPDVEVPFAPVVQEQTGFAYANIYWEVHGHEPAAYMVPHFDFHFYLIPAAKVHGIDCKDKSKPQVLPAGYMIGDCIPEMGMHAAPESDFNPKTLWKGSLLVGYYGGQPIFVEPMVTRELLLRRQSFSLPVPNIAPVPHVRYPRQFLAIYHPQIAAYDFTFFY